MQPESVEEGTPLSRDKRWRYGLLGSISFNIILLGVIFVQIRMMPSTVPPTTLKSIITTVSLDQLMFAIVISLFATVVYTLIMKDDITPSLETHNHKLDDVIPPLKHIVSNDYLGIFKNEKNNLLTEMDSRIDNTIGRYYNHKHLSPYNSFDAVDVPNPAFNKQIDEALLSTKKYSYYGDKALFLSYRLAKIYCGRNNGNKDLHVQLLLPNLLNEGVFAERASFLKKEQSYRTKDVEEELIMDLKRDVLAAVFGFIVLSDCDFTFNIRFHNDSVFLRYEVFDQFLVLSFLTMYSDKKFQPTLIYNAENQSLFYDAFKKKYSYQFELAKDNFTHLKHDNCMEPFVHLIREISQGKYSFDIVQIAEQWVGYLMASLRMESNIKLSSVSSVSTAEDMRILVNEVRKLLMSMDWNAQYDQQVS